MRICTGMGTMEAKDLRETRGPVGNKNVSGERLSRASGQSVGHINSTINSRHSSLSRASGLNVKVAARLPQLAGRQASSIILLFVLGQREANNATQQHQ